VNSAARSALIGSGYVLAYAALDALSFVHPLLKLGITPWNPDAGLTLAFLLIRGWRQAPWAAVAALLTEVIVHHAPGSPQTLICASAIISLGYGALAFELARRGFDQALASRRSVLELSFGAALAALAVASGYAATFVVSGILPVKSAADAIARNWVGDLNGVLTVTPLLLAVRRFPQMLPALRAHAVLVVSQTAALAVLMWLAFRISPSGDLPLYVLFAPAIWITLAWGVIGASAATLAIQISILIGAASLSAESLVETQFFLVTLALTAVLLGAVLDERARALARVAVSEAEQRALLAAAPDAVLTTDLAGLITSANFAAERLFAASASDLQGSSLSRWLPNLGLTESIERRRVAGARANGDSFPAEIACVRLDPPARPECLLIVRDMTEHDLAQTQIRERDSALSRAMRFALAGELSSALTHELNQPITALVSYLKAVEIMGEALETRDPRFSDTLHKAVREALRASDVLKRLRGFYRSGDVNVSVIDIRGLIKEVLSSFEDRAARLGIEITTDIDVTRDVCSDRTQLQMVMHNLVGNALDAVAEAAPGNRHVHVMVMTDDERLRASVEDSGRGVLLDVREQLFEPFVTSKVDGMGLGLAISRSLMRSQGGELRLDESRTTGARFLVELPLTLTRSAA
jgi:two-component system sensor kinase FixL